MSDNPLKSLMDGFGGFFGPGFIPFGLFLILILLVLACGGCV